MSEVLDSQKKIKKPISRVKPALFGVVYSKNPRIDKRRQTIYQLYLRRFTYRQIADLMKIASSTVVRDMRAIIRHNNEFVQTHPELLRESLIMVKEVLDSYGQIIREAWVNYANSKEPPVKNAFLNTIRQTEKQKAELLKLVGVEGVGDKISLMQVNVQSIQAEILDLNRFITENAPEEFQDIYEEFLTKKVLKKNGIVIEDANP